MKRALILMVLISGIVLFFSSCNKDESLNTTELTARELQSFVDDNSLFFCQVFLSRISNGTEIYQGVEPRSRFEIKAPYLVASETNRHYHLDRLIFFEAVQNPNGTGKDLHIYFR